MALDMLEWGVILVMGAGILIYGPDKIPEMAKTLAAAKKQFDGATKQLQGITKELQTGLNTGNLNVDTLTNALVSAGTAAGVAGTPSPQGAASGAAVTAAGVANPSLPGPPKKSADEMLVEMAKSLKIDTHGKTREEISQAIMEVVSTKSGESAPEEAAPVAGPGPQESPVAANETEAPVAVQVAEGQREAPPTQ